MINRQTIRARILSNPYYRFGSLEEIAIAVELGIRIDVNRASVDDWLRVPGISIHQAKTLVELAGVGVQFLSLEDIAAAISISVHRLKPLEPILDFCYYDVESLLVPQRINPNLASVEQLEKIPLIESALASTIVQNRQEYGSYRNLADLQRRIALSSQFISQLMHYLHF
ncbi:MAG: helix-hairpin-helix domain-containing protein [Microcystaceae cyanobacterium]